MRNKIVVVDDDKFDVSMLRRGLSATGAEVTLIEVNDSCAAVQVILDESPDMAILDLSMPKLDGFEILRAIRSGSRGEGTKIMILSGSTSVADRQKAEQLGVNWYRVKPGSLDGYHLLGSEIMNLARN